GPTTKNLPNAGPARMTLLNQLGAVLLDFRYDCDPPWPLSADGAGHSLVLYRPSYGEADPGAWKQSAFIGGSPGSAEPSAASPLNALRINEFLWNPTNLEPRFIEIYNSARFPVDISGCFLSGQVGNLTEFTIPEGTFIAPRGFLSFPQATNAVAVTGQALFTSADQSRVIDAIA